MRDRSKASSPSLRRPEMLPPAELREAALKIVQTNYGAGREEVIILVSRLVGFKATSAQLRASIDQVIDSLVANGVLSSGEDGTLMKSVV